MILDTSFKLALVMTVAASVSSMAGAIEPATGETRATQELMSTCPQVVGGLLSQAHIGAVLQARPIDGPAVCKCTLAKLEASPRVMTLLQLDATEFEKKMQSEKLSSFFEASVFSALFGCLSVDLDASLAKVTIE